MRMRYNGLASQTGSISAHSISRRILKMQMKSRSVSMDSILLLLPGSMAHNYLPAKICLCHNAFKSLLCFVQGLMSYEFCSHQLFCVVKNLNCSMARVLSGMVMPAASMCVKLSITMVGIGVRLF